MDLLGWLRVSVTVAFSELAGVEPAVRSHVHEEVTIAWETFEQCSSSRESSRRQLSQSFDIALVTSTTRYVTARRKSPWLKKERRTAERCTHRYSESTQQIHP